MNREADDGSLLSGRRSVDLQTFNRAEALVGVLQQPMFELADGFVAQRFDELHRSAQTDLSCVICFTERPDARMAYLSVDTFTAARAQVRALAGDAALARDTLRAVRSMTA